jgi:sugar lactone lactonase YvrE
MAGKFKRGDAACLVVDVPKGTVTSFRMDDDANIWCLLEWTDANGDEHQRWFLETQLALT